MTFSRKSIHRYVSLDGKGTVLSIGPDARIEYGEIYQDDSFVAVYVGLRIGERVFRIQLPAFWYRDE